MRRKHKLDMYLAKEKCEKNTEEKAQSNHDSVLAIKQITLVCQERKVILSQQMGTTVTDIN